MTMETLSIIYGIFLITWGIIVSLLSKSDSMTSFIPSFLGIPILIFAYLVRFLSVAFNPIESGLEKISEKIDYSALNLGANKRTLLFFKI